MEKLKGELISLRDGLHRGNRLLMKRTIIGSIYLKLCLKIGKWIWSRFSSKSIDWDCRTWRFFLTKSITIASKMIWTDSLWFAMSFNCDPTINNSQTFPRNLRVQHTTNQATTILKSMNSIRTPTETKSNELKTIINFHDFGNYHIFVFQLFNYCSNIEMHSKS
jgi:hypothetical protein